MPQIKLQNVSNIAAFGVEWRGGEDDRNRYQLMNPRGSSTLIFSALYDDQKEWMTTRVVEPSRFGMVKPPKSFHEFLAIARAYVTE